MAEPVGLDLDEFFLGYQDGRSFPDLADFDQEEGSMMANNAELTDEEWAQILGKVPTPDDLSTVGGTAGAMQRNEIYDLASSLLLPASSASASSTMAFDMYPSTCSSYTSSPPSSYAASPAASTSVIDPASFFYHPSSPDSGSESSPQSSPPTAASGSVGGEVPFGGGTLQSFGTAGDSTASMNLSAELPAIEPFPPRSPIFEMPTGNAGVAGTSSVGPHLGQPLAQPLHLHTAMTVSTAANTKTGVADDIKEEMTAASSGVVLPRETLLKLSSAEMEEYLRTLKSSSKLTHEEERGLKKQLRLIKNREYAQESRKKKKTARQELEGELTSLRTQNSELKTQNSALQSEVVLLNSKLTAANQENARLRAALRQMHAFQNKNSDNKRPRSSMEDSDSTSPSSPLPWFSLGGNTSSPKTTIAGGVCLLGVVIFALGFLLQGPGFMFGSSQRVGMAWSPTARVILQEEETTYYRRSTWAAPPPQSSPALDALPSSPPNREEDERGQKNAAAATCGYNNVCYLYQSKGHHVKTAEFDLLAPSEQRARELADERLRHDQNRTAIPIPVN